MAKREFLMLAHIFDDKKHAPGNWFMSEKLDGMRAFWDGGITRGLLARDVPFANVDKHHRFVDQDVRATGLWSRYGQVIRAPGQWLDQLPTCPLDGELYIGRGQFQRLCSIVKKHNGGEWDEVRYLVFDTPSLDVVFADGKISNPPNFVKTFKGVYDWLASVDTKCRVFIHGAAPFEKRYRFLQTHVPRSTTVEVHRQEQLPAQTSAALGRVFDELAQVCEKDGEGLMLRKPSSPWLPHRSHDLLKVKKMQDAEGVVVGYTWGKETDRGSRLLGMMGALVLIYQGKRFELSGFTDEERAMCTLGEGTGSGRDAAQMEGIRYPGCPVNTDLFHNPKFPLGCRVTFKYRELTVAGIPKEARYLRKHPGC